MTCFPTLLAGLLMFGAAPPPNSVAWLNPDMLAEDAALLKEAGVATDGPGLLAFIRKQTLTPQKRTKARKLIAQLADDDFQTRQQASEGLLDLGPVIVPLIRPATRSGDLEQRRRAERLLKQLEDKFAGGTIPAAARLLAAGKTPGGTAALLAYLPDAPNDSEGLLDALAMMSCPGGKPGREIVAVLGDAEPARKAAAAFVIGRSGSKEHSQAVLKLLLDKETAVRMGAALGLVLGREKKAIPVLIKLTAELPAEKRAAVEDVLVRLAGDDSPATPGDDTPAGRMKRHDLWLSWWDKNKAKVDLDRLRREAVLGYTLCVLFESTVRVTELGRDNKPRWTIAGLANAVDAHIVSGNRVLIAEYGAMRVTERTFDGKIVWEQKLGSGRSINGAPVLAQRLANGNTFITTQTGIIELDRKGKEVFARTDLGSVRAAWKYPDGRIAVVTGTNQYRRFTASGKEEKTYRVDLQIGNGIGGVDFLPDGGLLAVRKDRVVQYDSTGKQVWEAKGLQSPYCPTRLRNGHTIVACTGTKQFIEFDRSGSVVRKIPLKGCTPWVARRR